MTGYILAQCLMLLATPLLTRLYIPSDFAQLGYIMASVAIILPLLSLRLEYALPLTEQDEEASCLILLASIIVVVTSIFLAVILLLFYSTIKSYFQLDSYLPYYLLLIFLLQGFNQILKLQCLNHHQADRVAKGKLLQNVIMISSQLGFAMYFEHSASILIIGYLLGLLANFFYFLRLTIQYTTFSIKSLKHSTSLIRKHYKFPLHSSWTSALDSVATWLPVFIIGMLFGQNNAGLYFLVTRMFQLPIGLLGTSLSQVLLKHMSQRYLQQQSLLPLVKKAFAFLLSTGLVYLVVMYLVAPHLGFLLGTQWEKGSIILMVIAPAIVMSFTVSPLTNIFGVCGRNEICSLWQIIYLGLSAIALLIGYLSQHFMTYLIALSSLWIVSYVIYAIFVYKVASSSVYQPVDTSPKEKLNLSYKA